MSDRTAHITPTSSHGVVRHRVVPSLVTFVVAAVGIYLTAYLAIGLIQHIVMPVLAVAVAAWLAVQVWKLRGDEPGKAGKGRGTGAERRGDHQAA